MNYEEKKKALISQLKSTKGPVFLNKDVTNLIRVRNKKGTKLDIKNLNKVISVDTKNKIVEAEGMTTFDDLVKETLKFGYMPTVVPQFKTVTIGGALTGVGIESSSFKYGFVHETITEFEVLLSDGKTIICNKNQNSDLFYAFPNTYGTLGYALKVKMKIVPVKRYVKITHIPFNNSDDLFKEMKRLSNSKNQDFIDATIFNRNKMFITIGNFTDRAPYTHDYTYMNIYYKSIKKRSEDYLKTKDYIWRWDTDWFWCSKNLFVENPIIRFLFGRKNLNSRVYTKIFFLNRKYPIFGKNRVESIVQDVEIPFKNANTFLDFYQKNINIKPLWLCPIQPSKKKYPLYSMDSSQLYINFGFWDAVKSSHKNGYYNRLIESEVAKLKGNKSLYSTSFYTEKEFWAIFNKKVYDTLKKKYDPNNKFLNIFDKVVNNK